MNESGEPFEHKFVLCRVLGNELPPRDNPGSRLIAFNYILNNEHLASDTTRLWILNRILDQDLLQTIRDTLLAHRENFVEVDVDWPSYISAGDRSRQLSTLIGINDARNIAFRTGSRLAKFAFILDGDCFFNEHSWQSTHDAMLKDQEKNPQRQYYAVPSARIFMPDIASAGRTSLKLGEPMLVMRYDAEKLFDSTIPFGLADKTTLLFSLGLYEYEGMFRAGNDSTCAITGQVLHLCTGSAEVETINVVRAEYRKASLDLLLKRADELAARMLARKGYWLQLMQFKANRLIGKSIEICSPRIKKLRRRMRTRLRDLTGRR